MLVVIDTNVFISAIFKFAGNPANIVTNVFNGNLALALSYQQIMEIKNTLSYPKIKKLIRLTDTELADYIAEIELLGRIYDITNLILPVECRDKKDNYLLATLIASDAEYLITGDKDLLCLADKYPIVAPANFVDKYLQL
ncbi:MAG: twitching motility protein PilT [Burkholderiales bacterium]|jgi:putative PIN family toxin of toxin-antitoxin system|nr:twitching motility protein PilT [Burkholderiales bacterium]